MLGELGKYLPCKYIVMGFPLATNEVTTLKTPKQFADLRQYVMEK